MYFIETSQIGTVIFMLKAFLMVEKIIVAFYCLKNPKINVLNFLSENSSEIKVQFTVITLQLTLKLRIFL